MTVAVLHASAENNASAYVHDIRGNLMPYLSCVCHPWTSRWLLPLAGARDKLGHDQYPPAPPKLGAEGWRRPGIVLVITSEQSLVHCNPKRSAGFVFLPSSEMFSLHDKNYDAIYLLMLMSYNNYTSPHNRMLKRQNVPWALASKNSRWKTPAGTPFLSSCIHE